MLAIDILADAGGIVMSMRRAGQTINSQKIGCEIPAVAKNGFVQYGAFEFRVVAILTVYKGIGL